MADLLHVRATSALALDGEDTSSRVILWERNESHPGGEIWIADDAVHAVAPTPTVLRAIASSELMIVDAIDMITSSGIAQTDEVDEQNTTRSSRRSRSKSS